MPRPKGSKNKSPRKTAKPTSISTTDFTSLIAEKSSTKEALVADIASLEENLTALKADLKAIQHWGLTPLREDKLSKEFINIW